jgi:hypothetical protein
MPIALKSGRLNLLEPSGRVQACNGIALPSRRFCGAGMKQVNVLCLEGVRKEEQKLEGNDGEAMARKRAEGA